MWPLLEIAMKTTTFLGVASCALVLAVRQHAPNVILKLSTLGAAGIALIVLNVELSTSYIGMALDAAYLAICITVAARVRPRDEATVCPAPTEGVAEE